MVINRQCAFQSPTRKPCRMPPLRDGEFCWVHSPEHVKEVQEARKLGGIRRRRESTLSKAYQFESLTSVAGIRRIVELAVYDTLVMENSIARSRTLAYLAQVALHTLEMGDLEERIAALEELIQGKK
jgi:hypothetical protein